MSETLGFSNRSTPCFLGLTGRRKRPGSLWIQRSLRCRSSRGSRCFRSGCFRGFLCSRFFRSFLCSRFFRYFLRSGFLCWCFLGSSFFGRCFFSDDFLCWCFFRRGFLRRYFFCRCFFRRRFFSDYFFRRSFLRRYFFCRCFLWSSFFCRRFFRSCHSFLLDHVAKSTSRWEYAKRFAALGQRKIGPSAANTGAKSNAHSLVALLAFAILEIMLFLLVLSLSASHQSQDRAPPDWYSITRVSKKLRSFFKSIISLIHGNGFSSFGNRVSSPICVARRLAM